MQFVALAETRAADLEEKQGQARMSEALRAYGISGDAANHPSGFVIT